MKYEVHLASSNGEKKLVVDLERDGSAWRASIDGRSLAIDAVEISPHSISILLDGQSFEVNIAPSPGGKLKLQTRAQEFITEMVDPRAWSGRHHGGVEAEGRQQIMAPMPGKIVRVLVQAGDHVEAGQGLLVVEAMKMQNEIRSPKRGIVERVLVAEGQPVNAGEILCFIS